MYAGFMPCTSLGIKEREILNGCRNPALRCKLRTADMQVDFYGGRGHP